MPVRRGHVAPQNTFLGIIIRKFEGQSKYYASMQTYIVLHMVYILYASVRKVFVESEASTVLARTFYVLRQSTIDVVGRNYEMND